VTHELALTRAQVRAVDRLAIDELAIPGIVLMENAGLGAAQSIARDLPQGTRVGVVCGGGNNAGDGYVIARHLSNWGVAVERFEQRPASELSGDAATNRTIVDRLAIPASAVGTEAERAAAAERLQACSILLDGLLGTGFRGELRRDLSDLIEWVRATRAAHATTIALDLPSGLDCDSGRPANAILPADRTLTFAARKVGFDAPGAAEWTGPVEVIPIGVPVSLLERARRDF